MRKKSLAIIGTNGLPAHYGGFETLTNYLVEYLGNDFNITVYCSRTPKNKQIQTYNNSKLKYFPFKANGWQSIIYDVATIFHAYINYDTLIILGFSGAIAFPFNKIFKKQIIFNIGGIEWQKVRGSKSFSKIEIALKKWFEKICVKNSDTIIIDNVSFQDYLVKNYGVKPLLAEYGGDHAVNEPVNDALIQKYAFLKQSYDLTVVRAQEDMNIHLAIEAYKSVPHRNLVVVSNWQISNYGKTLYSENRNKYKNIILLNAIYDLPTINALRSNCSLYIHTHSLCGTAPSLVEAMSLNLPVICFDVPTNRATTEEKSLYFKNVDSLISLLRSLDGSHLVALRAAMSEISKRRYTWSRVTGIYRNCIQSGN